MPDQSSKNTRLICWMCLKIEIKSNGDGRVSGVFIVYFEDIHHVIWDRTLNLEDTTSFITELGGSFENLLIIMKMLLEHLLANGSY